MARWTAVVLAVLLGAACGRERPDAGAAGTGQMMQAAPTVSAAAAPAEVAEAGALAFVDVRTPEEYTAGHVEGAVNIPYDQMAQRWTELDSLQNRRVVLYCRTGHRAGIALEELRKHGFARAENGGGLDSLAAQGAIVVR